MDNDWDGVSPFAEINPFEPDGLKSWVETLKVLLSSLNEAVDDKLSVSDEDKFDLIRAQHGSLALSILLDALGKFDISDEEWRGLLWLREELMNAVAGASSPMSIAGAKKRGAPPRRADKFFIARTAGQAIRTLSPFYENEKDAIVAVQEILRTAGIRTSTGGSIPIATLTDWYGEFLTDESPAVAALKQSANRSLPKEKAEALKRVKRVVKWAASDPLKSINMGN